VSRGTKDWGIGDLKMERNESIFMCMCVGVVNCVGEKVEGRELSHMKELWQARRFSFIHEACPKDVTQDFFMQALYSSALGK
jgi:hypothetical protein